MPELPNKEHFNTREVADLFGVTIQTVYNWIEKYDLDRFKTPGGQLRIMRDSLIQNIRDYGSL